MWGFLLYYPQRMMKLVTSMPCLSKLSLCPQRDLVLTSHSTTRSSNLFNFNFISTSTYQIFLLVLQSPPRLYLLIDYATVIKFLLLVTACGEMVADIMPWVMGLVQAATVIISLPTPVSSQNRFCFISPRIATYTWSQKASPPPRAHDD